MSKEITEHKITVTGEETVLSKPINYCQTKPFPENTIYQYTKENPKITKTTKTYFRQVIRQTGPDGEVTEQIIENGDPISESIIISANDNRFNTKVIETGEMRYRYGKKIISESGEELVQEVDTGYVPTTLKIGNNHDLKDIIVSLPPGSSIIQKGFQSRFSTNKCSNYGEPEKTTGSEYQFYSNVSKTRVEADNGCDFTNTDSVFDQNSSDNKQSIRKPFLNNNQNGIDSNRSNIKEDSVFDQNSSDNKQSIRKPFLNNNQNRIDSNRSNIKEISKYSLKEIIKEGNVKASPCHPLPKSLDTQSHNQDIIFHLTVFIDLVLISSANKLGPTAALEYCEKDQVEACIFDNMANNNLTIKTPKRKSSRKSALFCVPQKDQTIKFIPEHSFILKFNKSNAVLVTEPLVLTVSDTKSRDEWIEAIMSNKSND